MAKRDYYDILGVKKGDSSEAIKKSYKKLALKYHPDRADSNKKKEYEERFKEINEAYSTLGDEEKRAKYDSGEAQFSQESGGHGTDASEIFRNLFRGGFGGQFSEEGREEDGELRYEIEIEFEEAAKGCEKEISIKKDILCESCHGTGAEDNQTETCHRCKGHGILRMEQETPWGMASRTIRCDVCYGEGKVPRKKCSHCSGNRVVSSREKVKFRIPAGVDDGQAMRIKNGGNAIRKGVVGDLFLYMRIKAHEIFRREGFDTHLEMPISFSKAALGGELSIPTLHGEVTIKIKKGTESGTVLRLKDKGIQVLNHPHQFGNEYVVIKVVTPKNLTKVQVKLFEELVKLGL
jgi:molecular chaperone DnaJ